MQWELGTPPKLGWNKGGVRSTKNGKIPTYVIVVPKRYGWTDGQTDNMQSHNRALRSIVQ